MWGYRANTCARKPIIGGKKNKAGSFKLHFNRNLFGSNKQRLHHVLSLLHFHPHYQKAVKVKKKYTKTSATSRNWTWAASFDKSTAQAF